MSNTFNHEHWIKDHWRPAMGWLYGLINLFDFIIFPIVVYAFAFYTQTPPTMWSPLTLQGGGLMHIAFGSIITATSWGRTREKLNELSKTEDNYDRSSKS